jgi:hypothetical protein
VWTRYEGPKSKQEFVGTALSAFQSLTSCPQKATKTTRHATEKKNPSPKIYAKINNKLNLLVLYGLA